MRQSKPCRRNPRLRAGPLNCCSAHTALPTLHGRRRSGVSPCPHGARAAGPCEHGSPRRGRLVTHMDRPAGALGCSRVPRQEGVQPWMRRTLALGVLLLGPDIVVQPGRVAALFMRYLRGGQEGEGRGHRSQSGRVSRSCSRYARSCARRCRQYARSCAVMDSR